MQLTNRTILVTGGGSGIGRGLAEAFHRQGNAVIIAGRRQAVLDEVTAANPGMRSLTLDVDTAEGVRGFAARLLAGFPEVDVLVNNAGIMRAERLAAGDPADAEATIATNLLGPIRLTAALLPHLQRQPRAAVINVTSGLAFLPLSITPTYSATKAALHSYTESLRLQLQGSRVEVVELAPPHVQTEIMPGGSSDERAMPLAAFIEEAVTLLSQEPTPKEVLVERVHVLRFAERDGRYDAVFKGLNDAFLAGAH